MNTRDSNSLPKIIQDGEVVDSLEVTDDFLKTSPDSNSQQLKEELKEIFVNIGQVKGLKNLEINLTTKQIQGQVLGSAIAISAELEVVRVHAGLVLENAQDIKSLADALGVDIGSGF